MVLQGKEPQDDTGLKVQYSTTGVRSPRVRGGVEYWHNFPLDGTVLV